MAERRFEVHPIVPYSLEASVRFLEGFAPASYDETGVNHLRLAFVADGGEAVAGDARWRAGGSTAAARASARPYCPHG